MASKKINWSDIFENEQALKNALKLIQELQKELKETAQLAKKDIQIMESSCHIPCVMSTNTIL